MINSLNVLKMSTILSSVNTKKYKHKDEFHAGLMTSHNQKFYFYPKALLLNNLMFHNSTLKTKFFSPNFSLDPAKK